MNFYLNFKFYICYLHYIIIYSQFIWISSDNFYNSLINFGSYLCLTSFKYLGSFFLILIDNSSNSIYVIIDGRVDKNLNIAIKKLIIDDMRDNQTCKLTLC